MRRSNMKDCIYRTELPQDYAAVESLTRSAFWNVYKPGCDEHYIIHILRGDPAVVTDLNTVCSDPDGVLLGHIFYTVSNVITDSGNQIPVLTFGPVSVLPEVQGQGIGSALIRQTLQKASLTGYPGLVITGNPRYYHRFGFRDAADYGITFEDGSSIPELMALELGDGRLCQAAGRIRFHPAFDHVDPEALERFDRRFPPRDKLRLPGQLG